MTLINQLIQAIQKSGYQLIAKRVIPPTLVGLQQLSRHTILITFWPGRMFQLLVLPAIMGIIIPHPILAQAVIQQNTIKRPVQNILRLILLIHVQHAIHKVPGLHQPGVTQAISQSQIVIIIGLVRPVIQMPLIMQYLLVLRLHVMPMLIIGTKAVQDVIPATRQEEVVDRKLMFFRELP
jgi:hypothetical protein